MKSIAIIGAGMAGLTLARHLSTSCSVELFEKSSGPGGRIASRVQGRLSVDHGAQFFTARSPQFQHFLTPLIEAGVVADWHADFVELESSRISAQRQWTEEFPHYVGVPDMAAIGDYLASGLKVHYQTRITGLKCHDGRWRVKDSDERERGSFDWVILTLPAIQSAALLPETFNEHARISQLQMKPCYALMLTLKQDPQLPFQAALVKQADISWISVNSSKPGREGSSLLVHSTNKWAQAQLDNDLQQVKKQMVANVISVTGLEPTLIESADIKRWHYANIAKQNSPGYFADSQLQLAACGDWCIKGRVEAAFTSARLLAEYLNGYD